MGCSSSTPLAADNDIDCLVYPNQTLKEIIIRVIEVNTEFKIRLAKLPEEMRGDIIRLLVDSMHQKVFDKNKIIIRPGATSDCCYFVSAGKVGVWDAAMNLTQTVTGDEFIGEFACLTQSVHAQSYVALQRTTVYTLTTQAIQKTFSSASCVFAQIPIFSNIGRRHRDELLPYCSVHSWGQTEVTIGKGCKLPPNSFYFISRGSIVLEITSEPLEENEYFGHEALLRSQTFVPSVIPLRPTVIFCVGKDGFLHDGFKPLRESLEKSLRGEIFWTLGASGKRPSQQFKKAANQSINDTKQSAVAGASDKAASQTENGFNASSFFNFVENLQQLAMWPNDADSQNIDDCRLSDHTLRSTSSTLGEDMAFHRIERRTSHRSRTIRSSDNLKFS